MATHKPQGIHHVKKLAAEGNQSAALALTTGMARTKERIDKKLSRASAYEKTDKPLAIDDKGDPSILHEMKAFMMSKEGQQMARKLIYNLNTLASLGDLKAMKELREWFSLTRELKLTGIVGHLHAASSTYDRDALRRAARGEHAEVQNASFTEVAVVDAA